MRLLALAAAALITTGIAVAPAQARPHGGPHRGGPAHHGGGFHHPGPRGHGWNRGRHCNWVWRHHHRVRRCF